MSLKNEEENAVVIRTQHRLYLKEVRLISYLLLWENLRSGVGQSLENLDFKKAFDYMMSLICGV